MTELRVGVIGLGMMGQTHLDVYARQQDVTVAAVSDASPDRLHGRVKAGGNIEGQAQGAVDLTRAQKYTEGMDLIHDPAVTIVDICLPTPMHRKYAEAAIKAGKHVLVEKPLCRSATDAFALADQAEASDVITMAAMCMRFWPGWDWLKTVVDDGRYGPLHSVIFRRITSHPGGSFYSNGDASGGALLDLHIHDTDFVQFLLGMPQGVFSRGYRKHTSEADHVITNYLFDDGPMVTAEGSWSMQPGFGFSMSYSANFERATALFDLAATPVLKVIRDGTTEPIPLAEGMGYTYEIEYFLQCVRERRNPERVTLRSAARSLSIYEAERESIERGAIVSVKR